MDPWINGMADSIEDATRFFKNLPFLGAGDQSRLFKPFPPCHPE
jgi:hypothetical protein